MSQVKRPAMEYMQSKFKTITPENDGLDIANAREVHQNVKEAKEKYLDNRSNEQTNSNKPIYKEDILEEMQADNRPRIDRKNNGNDYRNENENLSTPPVKPVEQEESYELDI